MVPSDEVSVKAPTGVSLIRARRGVDSGRGVGAGCIYQMIFGEWSFHFVFPFLQLPTIKWSTHGKARTIPAFWHPCTEQGRALTTALPLSHDEIPVPYARCPAWCRPLFAPPSLSQVIMSETENGPRPICKCESLAPTSPRSRPPESRVGYPLIWDI